ncbi:MAG: hypothetical protein LBJ95_00070 [Oscillospiraceae bacterium]|jgi:V/A-type H+-transporting ATPase subunit E|nr:hypothetical protein [Oscillospiraceae bacterium]
MTGLEKILNSITDDAKCAASEILENANKKAMDIKKEYELKIKEKLNEIANRTLTQSKNIIERAKSLAKTQKRNIMLETKQNMIKEMIEEAKNCLYRLPKDDYFVIILNMIEKFALPQRGDIVFSQKDKERLPKDFKQKIETMFINRSESLDISSETREIDGGFVLVYGAIEQNCSFNALFESSNDELSDLVNDILFDNKVTPSQLSMHLI